MTPVPTIATFEMAMIKGYPPNFSFEDSWEMLDLEVLQEL